MFGKSALALNVLFTVSAIMAAPSERQNLIKTAMKENHLHLEAPHSIYLQDEVIVCLFFLTYC
jgi:hypothetical protein